MPDLHIHRTHTLGLEAARTVALRWRADAEQRLGLRCRHESGDATDIIAFDATDRPRPASVADLIAAIRAAGRFAMADCSEARDAEAALAAGAEIVGSTLSGYTGGAVPEGPDYRLVEDLRRLTPRVVAEGRIHSPGEAAMARAHGAWCVVVGSAITRTEHVTSWFADALATGPK